MASPEPHRKSDRVVESRVLIDADALADALGGSVEEKDGRRAVRINGGRAQLVPPEKDLREYDRLVAVLHSEGETVYPKLAVQLGSRTKGLPKKDSVNSGPAEPRAFETWGDYLFPYENFLIYGMVDLLRPIETLTLMLKGEEAPPVWIAEIRAEKRDRADGPRLTDAGLLASLTLDARSTDDVIAHFRSRTAPRDIYGKLPPVPDGWTPAAADDICRHFIRGYDVGDPIDWRLNPNGYLEWMHAFNRHTWFGELLRAWHATKDPKYVKALDAIWFSWLRANPEPEGHNGGGDPAWETLSTAVRLYSTWLNAWFALIDCPHLRDSTRVEILKSFYGHAEHLLAYRGYGNNWLVVESRVLFALGLLFPEFERASLWLEAGRGRLARELACQIYPDGADWELAAGYHMMASRGFLEAYELATLNDVPLPPLFAERLPKTFDYTAGMTRPDGTLPSVNDSGGYRTGRRGDEFLAYGARLFDRPELLVSPEGPYAGESRIFPDSGFHMLASGTGHEALWSFIDCGGPGRSHQHYDALNVEIFAHGLPVIVDPGITSYLDDDWRAYYKATESHNTVLVNGAGQRHGGWVDDAAGSRGRADCALSGAVDYVRASYDGGYIDQPDGLVHTRAMLFVRGAYWVVFDEVTGDAAEAMEARFQFVPMRMRLDRRAKRFQTLRQDRPNLELICAEPRKGVKLDIVTGQTKPVGGWVSDGEDLPAPQARIRLKRNGEGPLRLVTVLFPFAQGVGSGVRIRPDQDAPDGIASFELHRPNDRADAIRYAWDGSAASVRTRDGEWAL